MATYKIRWKKSATKDLRNLDKRIIPGIIAFVEKIAENPYHNTRKLAGSNELYRARTGDYRIIYSIHEKIIEIEILHIGHRKDIYRKI